MCMCHLIDAIYKIYVYKAYMLRVYIFSKTLSLRPRSAFLIRPAVEASTNIAMVTQSTIKMEMPKPTTKMPEDMVWWAMSCNQDNCICVCRYVEEFARFFQHAKSTQVKLRTTTKHLDQINFTIGST